MQRLILLSLAVHLASAALPYPPPFLTGYFSGNPTISPIGPFNNYTVVFRPVDGNNELVFETVGNFSDLSIAGSYQNWWLEGNTLSYCGVLSYDGGKTFNPIVVHFVYRPDLSSTDTVKWCGYSRAGGCESFQFTIKVNDGDPNYVNWNVQMGPDTHMTADMKRLDISSNDVPVDASHRQRCNYENAQNPPGGQYIWVPVAPSPSKN